jgi:predicted metal-dependent peptidase
MRPVSKDSHHDRIALGRAACVLKAPYWGTLIHSFVYTPLDGIGTMLCTPNLILGYDPEWVMEAAIEELAADIAHECNHFMRKHFDRVIGMEDAHLRNLAGDLAINPDLRDAGWAIANEKSKRPAVFPKQFDLPEGLSTEEYYHRLLQQKQEKQSKARALPQPPGDDGSPGPSQPQGSVCAGHCGGIGGGADDPRLLDKLVAADGRSAVEIREITVRTAADIKEYVRVKGRGSVPHNIQEFAQALIEEPHVRWQQELAHVLRHASGRIQSGGADFSMQRPSKRSLVRGIPRPGMIEHQPEVGIVRDTSGSMNIAQLNACTREAYHLLQAIGVDEAWFADADAAVAMPWKRVGPQFFRGLDKAHGRGGTDFRPALLAAQKLHPRPELLVYCTDGEGPALKSPPAGMSVVWCLIGGRKAPARWGHAIVVSEDPHERRAAVILPEEDVEEESVV